MSSTLETPAAPSTGGLRSYELKSEFLQASLPRFQKNPGMFMTWLNTLCAVYLGVGILGVRNPQMFVFHSTTQEEAPPILESKLDVEPEKPKASTATEEESTPESVSDQLPTVVPIPVMDFKDVTFARPVEGMIVLDTKKIGSPDKAKPNVGIVGTVAKPGNPDAPVTPKPGASNGRRRLTADDVNYGPPVPRPLASKHGRVEIDPNTKIWVTFDDAGNVTEVRIEPHFSHAGYEREVQAHIRKHWHSKVGANSGWAPVE